MGSKRVRHNLATEQQQSQTQPRHHRWNLATFSQAHRLGLQGNKPMKGIASVGSTRPCDKSHFRVQVFPVQFTSSVLWSQSALSCGPGLEARNQSFPLKQQFQSISHSFLRENIPPFSFSTNVARLQSRKQKIKVSHDFRTQEKLIKSKFSQNVKSWTRLKTHLRVRVDFECFLRREWQSNQTNKKKNPMTFL